MQLVFIRFLQQHEKPARCIIMLDSDPWSNYFYLNIRDFLFVYLPTDKLVFFAEQQWDFDVLMNWKMAFNSVRLSRTLSPIWLRRGGVAGWWKVGYQYVCAQALQNKPINIPGSLSSCGSELTLTAFREKTVETPHIFYNSSPWLSYNNVFLDLCSAAIFVQVFPFLSDTEPLFVPASNSPLSVTKRLAGVKAITATPAKSFKGSSLEAFFTFSTLEHILLYFGLCWLI